MSGGEETYEFRVDGESFHVRLAGDEVDVRQGPAADPDLTVSGNTEILLAVVAGRLTPSDAVEAGAIAPECARGSLARRLALLVRPEGSRDIGARRRRPRSLAEPWLASAVALYTARVALATTVGRSALPLVLRGGRQPRMIWVGRFS